MVTGSKLRRIARYHDIPLRLYSRQSTNSITRTVSHSTYLSLASLTIEDYLEFQGLLLNKDVKFCADVHYIKTTNTDENQCPLGTIRILLDPYTRTRSILYFRHTSDQKDGFVEWPGESRVLLLALTDWLTWHFQRTYLKILPDPRRNAKL